MIVPLTTDEEWKKFLHPVLAWQPPQVKTIVIAPHPDDETLGAGGLIATLRQSAHEVTVVAVTDGECAYADMEGLGAVRRQEQERALKTLGVDPINIVRLGLPDREVSRHESEFMDMLDPLAEDGCHIVAPWMGDFHPDHETCGRAAKEIARRRGLRLSFYFFWTWHRGTPLNLAGLSLGSLRLSDFAVRLKGEALSHHRSQLEHPSGEPILPEHLLGPVRWPHEVFVTA